MRKGCMSVREFSKAYVTSSSRRFNYSALVSKMVMTIIWYVFFTLSTYKCLHNYVFQWYLTHTETSKRKMNIFHYIAEVAIEFLKFYNNFYSLRRSQRQIYFQIFTALYILYMYMYIFICVCLGGKALKFFGKQFSFCSFNKGGEKLFFGL